MSDWKALRVEMRLIERARKDRETLAQASGCAPVAAPSLGPPDEEVLRTIQARLAGDDQFDHVEFDPSPERIRAVVAHYRPTLYPETVEAARLDIRWHIGGDYSVHYVEHATDGTQLEYRWDRHLESTGRRHVHSPPDAGPPELTDLRRITVIC